MATFTVTTAADLVSASDGKLSLREAVEQANATTAADRIVFASALEGRTLTLTGGALTLQQDATIDGDQNNDGTRVTVSGGGDSRMLELIGFETDVSLVDLTFRDGNSEGDGRGGAVYSGAHSLTVVNATFADNATFSRYIEGRGGAIYCRGEQLVISDSVFLDNRSAIGGAIATDNDAIHSITVKNSRFSGNYAAVGGAADLAGDLVLENSTMTNNYAGYYHSGGGGGLSLYGSGHIIASSITDNRSLDAGGGIRFFGTGLVVENSTIADNQASYYWSCNGGGISVGQGDLTLRNSTVTGNHVYAAIAYGGSRGGGIGFSAYSTVSLDIANSIVAGNSANAVDPSQREISGTITRSNGHNVFGSDVTGDAAGDLENVAASTLFASVDPDTGGGRVNAAGVVPLRADAANPAISAADRLLAPSTDQLGNPRPAPGESSADIGAAESGFVPSHVASTGNDVLTGTTAANAISGLAGHDVVKGLAGNDTLSGNNGGDFLTGGLGNDKLNGGNGSDLVNYADLAVSVTVDLRGDAATDTDTARRGSETDTLTGIEGAVGSSAGDIFFGDNGDNWFQGGGGKDTFTGGSGRDLYDYNLTSAAGLGTGRDVITDFDHLVDDIDLAGIDADATVAGNQAFRWVATAALTGAGEVGYYTADGNTIVRMSTDADAASEGEIQLSGIRTLTAVDFYL